MLENLIIIPARLASQRLAQKPLIDLCGVPMIIRTAQQAQLANMGEVVIATCGPEIADLALRYGFKAVITDPNLNSGSDRIWAAYKQLGSPPVKNIINVQGDLPLLDPQSLGQLILPLQQSNFKVSTLACPITNLPDLHKANIVKVALDNFKDDIAEAIYFSRMPIPYEAKVYYEHIGLYAYKPEALQAFVSASPSYLEVSEKLEQLRFLANGFKIGVNIVNHSTPAVDVASDVETITKLLNESLRAST